MHRKYLVRNSPPDNGNVKADSLDPPDKLSPAQREYSDMLMRLIKNHGGEVGARMIKKLPPPE
jgi:hypothetical protein